MDAKTRALSLVGTVLCAALLPVAAAAQPTPVSPRIQVSSPSSFSHFLPSVAARPDGGFVAAWLDSSPGNRVVRAAVYPTQATAAAASPQVSQSIVPLDFVGPSVAVHASGNFLVVWPGVGPLLLGRVFDAAGTPRTGEFEIRRYPGESGLLTSSVAATPEGFVVAWSGPVTGERRGIFARRYDAAGAPLGSELRVDTGTVPTPQEPAVATDAAGGFAVVWEGLETSLRIHATGRLFDASGTPRSGELELGEPADFQALDPSVAFGADGGFLVAWVRTARRQDVVGRLFAPDGAPRGPAVRLSEPTQATRQKPRIAADPGGGFVVVFASSFGPRGRRVDAAGRPQGITWLIDAPIASALPPAAAFTTDGELVVAWHDQLNGGSVSIVAQRFRFPASAGAEACLASGRLFVCDPLRTGEPGLVIRFEAQPGDVPLLGDLNGDGQDDPCFYRAGVFFCDFDHNGHPEGAVRFGLPGDAPLLGDVNGDGRDDACLRRVRRFACDTAHNGGTAEVQVVFGLKTWDPLESTCRHASLSIL